MTIDPFKEFMTIASDPQWRDQVAGTAGDMGSMPDQGIGADVYLACFATPAGRAVLADLYNRYVNVSTVVPGEPEGSGFYREGSKQVVFEIAAMCEAAAQGEEGNADEG